MDRLSTEYLHAPRMVAMGTSPERIARGRYTTGRPMTSGAKGGVFVPSAISGTTVRKRRAARLPYGEGEGAKEGFASAYDPRNTFQNYVPPRGTGRFRRSEFGSDRFGYGVESHGVQLPHIEREVASWLGAGAGAGAGPGGGKARRRPGTSAGSANMRIKLGAGGATGNAAPTFASLASLAGNSLSALAGCNGGLHGRGATDAIATQHRSAAALGPRTAQSPPPLLDVTRSTVISPAPARQIPSAGGSVLPLAQQQQVQGQVQGSATASPASSLHSSPSRSPSPTMTHSPGAADRRRQLRRASIEIQKSLLQGGVVGGVADLSPIRPEARRGGAAAVAATTATATATAAAAASPPPGSDTELNLLDAAPQRLKSLLLAERSVTELLAWQACPDGAIDLFSAPSEEQVANAGDNQARGSKRNAWAGKLAVLFAPFAIPGDDTAGAASTTAAELEGVQGEQWLDTLTHLADTLLGTRRDMASDGKSPELRAEDSVAADETVLLDLSAVNPPFGVEDVGHGALLPRIVRASARVTHVCLHHAVTIPVRDILGLQMGACAPPAAAVCAAATSGKGGEPGVITHRGAGGRRRCSTVKTALGSPRSPTSAVTPALPSAGGVSTVAPASPRHGGTTPSVRQPCQNLDLTRQGLCTVDAAFIGALLPGNRTLVTLQMERNSLTGDWRRQDFAGLEALAIGLRVHVQLGGNCKSVSIGLHNGRRGDAGGQVVSAPTILDLRRFIGPRLGRTGEVLSPPTKRMREVVLHDCGLREADMLLVSELLRHNGALQVLSLSHNALCGPEMNGLRALASALRGRPELRELKLVDVGLCGRRSSWISAGCAPSRFLMAQQTGSSAGSVGTERTVEALQAICDAIAGNADDQGRFENGGSCAPDVAAGGGCAKLEAVDLSSNDLQCAGGAVVAKRLVQRSATLQRLNISNNALLKGGTDAIAQLADSVEAVAQAKLLAITRAKDETSMRETLRKEAYEAAQLDIASGVSDKAAAHEQSTKLKVDFVQRAATESAADASEEAQKIAKIHSRGLRELDLSDNDIGGAQYAGDDAAHDQRRRRSTARRVSTVAIAQAKAEEAAALTKRAQAEAIAALGRMLRTCTTMQKLDVTRNALGADAGQALLQAIRAPDHPSLQVLNSLPVADLRADRAAVLNLRGVGLGDSDAHVLAQLLGCASRRLKSIMLQQNDLSDRAKSEIGRALLDSEQGCGVQFLAVDGWAVAAGHHALDVSSRALRTPDVLLLAGVLKYSTIVTSLNLSNNAFQRIASAEVSAVAAICCAVASPSSRITKLQLASNTIGDKGLRLIIAALRGNHTMVEVDLSDNGLCDLYGDEDDVNHGRVYSDVGFKELCAALDERAGSGANAADDDLAAFLTQSEDTDVEYLVGPALRVLNISRNDARQREREMLKDVCSERRYYNYPVALPNIDDQIRNQDSHLPRGSDDDTRRITWRVSGAALDELDQENDVKRDGARRSVNARRKKQGPAINYIDNKGRKGKLLHIDAQPGTPRTRGPIFFAKIRDSDFERSVRTTSKASEGESARNETQISWGTKMLHHGNMYG